LRKEPIRSIVTRIRKEYKPTLLITSIRFYEKFNFQEGIKNTMLNNKREQEEKENDYADKNLSGA
jgi:hypothetical protein